MDYITLIGNLQGNSKETHLKNRETLGGKNRGKVSLLFERFIYILQAVMAFYAKKFPVSCTKEGNRKLSRSTRKPRGKLKGNLPIEGATWQG